MSQVFKIESMLSARLFLSPQLAGDRLFFISDLSGRMSLYAMDRGGSVPEPLLPPDIALQNPALMNGYSFYVFPELGQIVVMIDQDGDENYQPCVVPLDGGIPELLLGEQFAGQQVNLVHCDGARSLVAFSVDPRTSPLNESLLVDLATRQVTGLGTSPYGNYFDGHNDDYSKITLIDVYTVGDTVIYLWQPEAGERRLLYGKPLDQRAEGEQVPLNAMGACQFTPGDRGILCYAGLFDDRFGLAYFRLDAPHDVKPVEIVGAVHHGEGEFDDFKSLKEGRYLLKYNIDGVSWVYEGTFDEAALRFQIDRVVVGTGALSNGVVQSLYYDKASGDYALSFSTATSPAQIYTIEGLEGRVVQHTRERILGIPQRFLSPGEDASYTSHDGLRVSARLYLPAAELGFVGRRPVVFYIHGGPQSQEKPDFCNSQPYLER